MKSCTFDFYTVENAYEAKYHEPLDLYEYAVDNGYYTFFPETGEYDVTERDLAEIYYNLELDIEG